MVENDQGYGQKRLQGIVENDQENKLENKLNSSSQIFEQPKIDDNAIKNKKIALILDFSNLMKF